MKKLLLFFLITTFYVNSSFANEISVVDLSKTQWEYRWGDSPFKDDVPLWSVEETQAAKWQEISFPSNPPSRDGKTNVWYRVQLPESLPKDPHIYIFSIDLISQVYYKGEQIYHFGDFDENGQGEFKGWPWHMISIPAQSGGEYLYFRVYSNYLDIGLWGEILVASKGYIFQKLLKGDIPKIMIGAISIFLGILFMLSFLSKFRKIELLTLGLLFFTQGLDVLVSAKVIELYIFYPLVKQYILAGVFFFFPLGMAFFIDKTIKQKIPFNLIKRLWQIHLVYFVGAIVGAIVGLYDIPSTYQYFDILYNFITLPILTIFMIYFFFKGDREIKIITFSFLIISVYWFYSSLIAYGWVPWEEYPNDVAIFSCLFLFSYSILSKLNYTQKLKEEKDELEIISSKDYKTQLYNRKKIDIALEENENFSKRYKDKFSIILLDIDDFKKVNDTYGHLIGDDVILGISNILTKFTRNIDIVGRWGGEEFIVICPKTNKKEASLLAEKLRKKIEKNDFNKIGNVTASFGVSSYEESDSIDSLLTRTDEAMYLSKKEGKNRVSIK